MTRFLNLGALSVLETNEGKARHFKFTISDPFYCISVTKYVIISIQYNTVQ